MLVSRGSLRRIQGANEAVVKWTFVQRARLESAVRMLRLLNRLDALTGSIAT